MMKCNMNNDILYRIFENKSKLEKRFIFNKSVGKLETSIDLVREMIYLLPEDLFVSNDTTFLDPCAGTGTFILVILERLLKYKSYDIAIKQVYMSEINPSLVNGYLSNMIFLPKSKIKLEINSDWINEYFNLLIDFISGKTKTFNDLSYIIYRKSIKIELDNMILNITKFIEKYEKVSKLESKLFGEVFTPKNLVKEMISYLPEYIWKDKNIKWLDPAVGIGNFPSVIVEKLMKGLEDEIPLESERYKWIMEEMIYMCDISTKNLFLLYKLFDENNSLKLNVYRGSFLENGFNKYMKEVWGLNGFDVVVGNPPYLKGVWVKFFKKALPLVNYGVIISPDGTKNLSKVSNNLIDLLQANNIQSLTDHTNYFDVSSGNLVTYYFNKFKETNKEAHIDNGQSKIIIDKIINNSNDKIESKLSNNRSKLFNAQKKIDDITDDFSIKIVENVRRDGITYKFLSNSNELNSNIIKYNLSDWFITNRYLGKSIDPSIYCIDEQCSIGSNITIIRKWGTGNLDNFKQIYSTKLFRFVLDFLRNGMFDTSPRHINMLPKMDLSKKWTNLELYNYFNLTKEEIDLIENTIKD